VVVSGGDLSPLILLPPPSPVIILSFFFLFSFFSSGQLSNKSKNGGAFSPPPSFPPPLLFFFFSFGFPPPFSFVKIRRPNTEWIRGALDRDYFRFFFHPPPLFLGVYSSFLLSLNSLCVGRIINRGKGRRFLSPFPPIFLPSPWAGKKEK